MNLRFDAAVLGACHTAVGDIMISQWGGQAFIAVDASLGEPQEVADWNDGPIKHAWTWALVSALTLTLLAQDPGEDGEGLPMLRDPMTAAVISRAQTTKELTTHVLRLYAPRLVEALEPAGAALYADFLAWRRSVK